MRGAWAGHASLPRTFILFTIATCSLAANPTGARSAGTQEALAEAAGGASVRGVAVVISGVLKLKVTFDTQFDRVNSMLGAMGYESINGCFRTLIFVSKRATFR